MISFPLPSDFSPGRPLVRVGSAVRFAFPYTERRRSKVRPGLIVALDRARREVVVCYGSSRLYGVEAPEYALRLVTQDEWEPLGLHGPTRFQVDRRIRVPLTSSKFRLGPNGEPPVLGQLPPRLAQRAADLYAALPSVEPTIEAAGMHPGPAEKRRPRPRLHRRRIRQDAA